MHPVPVSGRSSQRDLRIDLIRGLALLVIFVTHVKGNSLALLTPRTFGFSDAAEVFVFLSGWVCGLVYTRAMARHGALFCAAKALARCAQIYVALIFTTFVILSLYSAYPALAPEAFQRVMGSNSAGLRILALAGVPGVMRVLTLYLVLLAALPLMLFLHERSRWGMLAISVSLYLGVQISSINLPAPWDDWFFNPFAWQLLYFVGVALGNRPGFVSRRLPSGRSTAVAAGAVLLTATLVKFVYAMSWKHPMPLLYRADEFKYFYLSHKTNLGIVRVLYFFTLAYFTSLVLPQVSVWWERWPATVLIRTGQNSLEVFCFGALLSELAGVVLARAGGGYGWMIGVTAVGGVMIIAFGASLSAAKAMLAAPRPQPIGVPQVPTISFSSVMIADNNTDCPIRPVRVGAGNRAIPVSI